MSVHVAFRAVPMASGVPRRAPARGLDHAIAAATLLLLIGAYLLFLPGGDPGLIGGIVLLLVASHLLLMLVQAAGGAVPLYGGRFIGLAGVSYWFLLEVAQRGGEYDEFSPAHVLHALILVQVYALAFLLGHAFFLRRARREADLLAHLVAAPRGPTGWTFALLAGGLLGLMPILVYGGGDVGAIVEGVLGSRAGSIGWGRSNLGDERSPVIAMTYFGWATAGLAGVFLVRLRGWRFHRAAGALVGGVFLALHFLGGTRHLLAILVLPVLGAIYLGAPPARRRRTTLLLVAGAVVMYLAFQVQQHARTRGFMNLERERLVEQLKKPRGHEQFIELLHVTDLVPQRMDYVVPGSVFFHVAINPIPRALWPGKPVDRFWRDYAALRVGSDVMTGGTTLSYSHIGQFYVEGGMAMVIACALFFAWWAAVADDLARRHGARPEVLYVACLLMVLMLLSYRGLVAGILYVVPAAMILLAIGRGAERFFATRVAWPASWWSAAPWAWFEPPRVVAPPAPAVVALPHVPVMMAAPPAAPPTAPLAPPPQAPFVAR